MSLSQELLPGVPLIESPLFSESIDALDLSDSEKVIARQLHDRGFALIDFPDPEIEERMCRIRADLGKMFSVELEDAAAIKTERDLRLQDAWTYNDDVRQIAANDGVISLLSKLYGRRAFPFQTLNFPVGTQQALHSDSIHFSSIPERFMCGVWLAFEDVSAEAGPLEYVPGSHKWPILTNAAIGRTGASNRGSSAQDPFEDVWSALVRTSGIQREQFLPKKGKALIWAANLLHGGAPQIDNTLTRWSQVTHYYFENCAYYTPAFSNEGLGQLDLRTITNIATGAIEPNLFLGKQLPVSERDASPSVRKRGIWPARGRSAPMDRSDLPEDFDAALYYQLNPDVAAAGVDAEKHYLLHGRGEGRRYQMAGR